MTHPLLSSQWYHGLSQAPGREAASQPSLLEDIHMFQLPVQSQVLHVLEQPLTIDAPIEVLFERIPELSRMEGWDQQTPHHLLDLGAHSKRAWENGYHNQWLATKPYRHHVLLALAMHDAGKYEAATPLMVGGAHVFHNGKPRLHYPDHEHKSVELIETVLRTHFSSLHPMERMLVKRLALTSSNGLLKLEDAYHHRPRDEHYHHQKSQCYQRLIEQAMRIPVQEPLSEKIRLVIQFCIADKEAAYDKGTQYTDPKAIKLVERRQEQVALLRAVEEEFVTYLQESGLDD